MRRTSQGAALLLAAITVGCATARPKALVIGIDGLRPDQLELAHTPALDQLARDGALTGDARNAWTPKEAWNGHSATNWGVMLTGVRPDVADLTHNGDTDHRVSDDAFLAGRVAVPTMFGRLKAVDAELETACFNTWSGIGLEPGTILGDSRSAVDGWFSSRDEELSSAERDVLTTGAAVEALQGSGRFGGADMDLVFVHLSQCDSAGHAGTYADADYRASIESVDALVGEMIAAIQARPGRTDEQWLVLVSTDHGGRSDAGQHADNTLPLVHTIPFLVAADGILPGRIQLEGASLYDVVPTVLAWMGIEQDWKLPGTARVPR